ncbi:MAG TPA: glycerophosphodiester phosphodiesterase [Acidimicrobiales bacterium]|nr:glycerophosphodiester phosphodiesterase [Acidimicrobiales bacterium]
MISVIAHRGASADRPENTLEAFAEAARQGADGVELDVRRGPDGGLVVRHDPLPPGAAVPASVPSLAAALDACRGLLVNVEVKNLPHEPGWDPEETVAAEVVALLRARGGVDRVVVSSFSLATVDAVRAAAPGVPTGLLTPAWFEPQAALALVVERGHGAVHPYHEALTPELVAAAHEAGVSVTTWTVDEAGRLREVAALGVDAVITNRPGFARAVLSA